MTEQEDDEREYLRHPKGYVVRKQTGYIQLSVPTAIQPKEWDWYSVNLRLSEAQRAALNAEYHNYRQADWDERKRNLQGCWDRSADLASAGVGVNEVATKLFVGLLADVDVVRAKLDVTESAFLDRVAELLAAEQLEHWPLVSAQRARAKAAAVLYPIPACTIDLETLLAELYSEGLETSLADGALHAVRVEYSAVITEPFKRRGAEDLTTWSERLSKQAQSSALLSTGDANDRVRAVEIVNESRTLGRRIGALAARAHELNVQYVERFAIALPQETASAFKARFWLRSTPLLFPDPHDVTSILEGARSIEPLTQEQATSISEIAEAYNVQSGPVLARMSRDYIAWRTERVATSAANGANYAEYARRMVQSDEYRRLCAEQTIERLKAALTPDQVLGLAAVEKRWHDRRAEILADRQRPTYSGDAWPQRDK